MFIASMQPKDILVVPQPVAQCAYCWYVLNPSLPYPESWSSTICPNHENWILNQLATRRAKQQAEKARVQA